MSDLVDCLLTDEPKVSDFPAGITHPPDPVSWSLEMFANNLPEADMQSRESRSGKQESKLTYFDQKDPASFDRFKQRIENAQPVHGSLALIDHCTGDGTVRDNADWARQVYEEQFARGLAERHPMGSYLSIILSALLTMIVSSISWHLVEMPINGLKRYFTYSKRVK